MPMFKKISPSTGPSSPEVHGFYHEATGSIQYVVIDPATRKAALIDVVQDFAPESATTSFETAEEIVSFVRQQNVDVDWILDTHPHADHLMASAWLKDKLGAPNAIGEKVSEIAAIWSGLYNLPDAFDPAADFDRLFADGDTFRIGELPVRVMLSSGHTLGSVTYVVGDDAAFVHDTFMQPDSGTARCDFPGGSARELYASLQVLLALPDPTRLFIGHDYGTDTREEPAWEATVAEQRRDNIHLRGGTPCEDYVEIRTNRDKILPLPDRILAALQVNLRAGRLPPPEADGHHYLKIPLNRL